ncbi:MAG: DsrE family protein [Chitinophagaceae bacterium]
MNRKILFALIVLSFSVFTQAQTSKQSGKHRVVFQLTTDDTVVHKGLLRQLNNVLTAAPGATLEVVCHGPGINFLMKDKTIVHEKIQEMKSRGVQFAACENTLKEKNISKDKIIPEAFFVPSALVEIVTKQEAGWSYIKAGF